jgi:hypothetical protein
VASTDRPFSSRVVSSSEHLLDGAGDELAGAAGFFELGRAVLGVVRLGVHRMCSQVRERVACAVRGDLGRHRIERGGVPEQLQEGRAVRLAQVQRDALDRDDHPRRDRHRDQDRQQRLAHTIGVGDEMAEAQGAGFHVHFSSSNRIGISAQPSTGRPASA